MRKKKDGRKESMRCKQSHCLIEELWRRQLIVCRNKHRTRLSTRGTERLSVCLSVTVVFFIPTYYLLIIDLPVSCVEEPD
jgi:hypothetical protein